MSSESNPAKKGMLTKEELCAMPGQPFPHGDRVTVTFRNGKTRTFRKKNIAPLMLYLAGYQIPPIPPLPSLDVAVPRSAVTELVGMVSRGTFTPIFLADA